MLKNFLIKILATVFGLGFLPVLPGTAGSFVGVILFYFLRAEPRFYLFGLAGAVTLIGIFVSSRAEKIFGTKDAQVIVIDEVAGQLITFLFVPFSMGTLIAGFVLFRLFDIIKIFPARWAQDKLPRGWGVVGDDVVAGIQAGIVLMVLSQ